MVLPRLGILEGSRGLGDSVSLDLHGGDPGIKKGLGADRRAKRTQIVPSLNSCLGPGWGGNSKDVLLQRSDNLVSG